ncbi:helix-turn-helix domain-containing protein [Ectothiorhodospira mobilis]|uniref:helix-turn-helix domain-containing protein n=1 Tax=Ectothiorhodospira mobilis TaxID=195064 RepID=UPI001EE9884C|nr:helix-turn-helix domain-containing protein [Ectothiorhodospira mobilis]MCG5535700.1 helix-turn-helix domain-containing protein [Ectothiorhodospira mobilis]
MVEANRNRARCIGQNVAAIRQRRGLTLEGLAELSSVSRASISALENGADNPRVQTLWNLADALGVDFGTLIGDSRDECVLDEDGASFRLIDRQTSPKIVEAYLLEFPAGATRNARPHVAGVQEHVVVLSGELLTGPTEGPSLLASGQSVSFTADVPHIYSAGRMRTRAIVTVVYPRLDHGARSDQELNWPRTQADWGEVYSLMDRAAIEVQNGVGIDTKRFHLPAQMPHDKGVSELRSKVANLPPSPTVRRFVLTEGNPGVLSLYRAPQMTRLPAAVGSLQGTLADRCRKLAGLATAPSGACDLERIQHVVLETSSLMESALAAEVLTRHGRPTVPLGVGTMEQCPGSDGVGAQRLFEARIDVDAYEAFELVHPAYARQMLALAGHLPGTEGLRILEVGTGPGLPLAMLRELRPDLQALAVDPSEVAFRHLTRRFARDPAVEIRKTSITEMDPVDPGFEVAVSVGASHPMDTSAFLAAIRDHMRDDGRLLVADEMICAFSDREQRQAALIRHHLWYILDTLVEVPKEAHKGDIQIAERLAQALPEALGMAYSQRGDAAMRRIRDLYEEVMEIDRPRQPSHPLAVFSRFHLLELQALIAGFDYEVEQKTHAARFKALARANGFEIRHHHRIYATDGDGLEDAGTHLLVLEAV